MYVDRSTLSIQSASAVVHTGWRRGWCGRSDAGCAFRRRAFEPDCSWLTLVKTETAEAEIGVKADRRLAEELVREEERRPPRATRGGGGARSRSPPRSRPLICSSSWRAARSSASSAADRVPRRAGSVETVSASEPIRVSSMICSSNLRAARSSASEPAFDRVPRSRPCAAPRRLCGNSTESVHRAKLGCHQCSVRPARGLCCVETGAEPVHQRTFGRHWCSVRPARGLRARVSALCRRPQAALRRAGSV